MSFLHSEQPKCNKILPPFKKMLLFYFLWSPAMNLRTQSAPSFTSPSDVKYTPLLQGVAPHLPTAVHGKSLLGLVWLSCVETWGWLLSIGLRSWHLSQAVLEKVCSYFPFTLAFDSWFLNTNNHRCFKLRNYPWKPCRPFSACVLFLPSLIPVWEKSGSALGGAGLISASLHLFSPCPLLCIFI